MNDSVRVRTDPRLKTAVQAALFALFPHSGAMPCWAAEAGLWPISTDCVSRIRQALTAFKSDDLLLVRAWAADRDDSIEELCGLLDLPAQATRSRLEQLVEDLGVWIGLPTDELHPWCAS
jgi:hypothetical protein